MADFFIWTFLAVVSLSPLIFWLPLPHYDPWLSLGQASALVGLAMYSLEMILSNFVPQWKKHHLLGGMAFILLMIHPLALIPAYGFKNLLPGDQWTINLGIISLLLTMALLLLTFFVVFSYPVWKSTHRFLGLAFLIGALHGFLVDSNLARENNLKIYMLVLVGLGFLFWIRKLLRQ
jgi:predicted ferric reductase